MGPFYDGPFRRELRRKQEEFLQHMMKGHGALTLAVDRKTIELMEADLAKGQSAFEYLFQPNPFAVGAPAFRWGINTELLGEKMLIPAYRDKAGYEQQVARFKAYADQLRSNVDRAYKFIHDTGQSRELWVVRRNLPTKEVIERIAWALGNYLQSHATDDDVLRIRPQEALWKMLSEDRPDLQMMLRMATSLPNDIQAYTIERKAGAAGLVVLAQQALYTLFYALAVIGSAVSTLHA